MMSLFKDIWITLLRNFYDENGQGTVEFAVVTAAILAIFVSLGLLWNISDQGILVDHALRSASHHLKEAALGIVGDLFCY